MLETLHLKRWIAENRASLRPPVGNAQLFKASWRNFIVMVVGGPNLRIDYHDDPGEELFYQLEGDIVLRVIEHGRPRDIPIPEGEMLLLPPHVRHSPQRPAGSVGLVIERLRLPGERDAFEWYCERCLALVHRHELELKDIEADLPPVFRAYEASEATRTCRACGHRNPGRAARGAASG
jgi:3-hydroxyanthranilate 3,4-dioxygenase